MLFIRDVLRLHDRPLRWWEYLIVLAPLVMLIFLLSSSGAYADAADAPPPGSTVALGLPIWSIAVGALVPLVTYVLNRLSATEPIATFVLLFTTTVAGALTQLVDAGSVGFDANTLKYVLTAVAAALAAHHMAWKPGAVNVALGKHAPVPKRHKT